MLNKNIGLYEGTKLKRTDKKTTYNFKKLLRLSVNIFINYNKFIRTTDDFHKIAVQKWLTKLLEKNLIYLCITYFYIKLCSKIICV